jgi:hypothetical protein
MKAHRSAPTFFSKSLSNRLFEFFPRFMHRKMNVAVVPAGHSDDFADGVVKSRSEVVDNIADSRRESGHSILARMPEIGVEVASFRVSIDKRAVKISREEIGGLRLHLCDVVIGPFNLPARA